MDEQLSSLAVTHLLQHTLRSFCIHDNSQWVYAVFWRILPRNYPLPKWDTQGGVYERSRGNRRNWILVWEDGFCNFAATTAAVAGGDSPEDCPSSGHDEYHHQHYQGLQPELFFKMSHEIYNYGEGLIGKVAADHSHKWIYKEPTNQEINSLSAWQNSADSQPRTWEAQFQSGIKTIALIAVREGVIQLGAVDKVVEDLSYIVLLRKKFSYIESIPGVLLPHPSSTAASYPFKNIDGYGAPQEVDPWAIPYGLNPTQYTNQYYENCNIINQNMPMKITPSMSSLEALLSKLPSVVVPAVTSPPTSAAGPQPQQYMSAAGGEKVAKEEFDEEGSDKNIDVGETSSSISSYQQQQPLFGYHHHHHNNNLHPSDQTTMHNHGPY